MQHRNPPSIRPAHTHRPRKHTESVHTNANVADAPVGLPLPLNPPVGRFGEKIAQQEKVINREDIDLLGLKQALTSLQVDAVVKGFAHVTTLPVVAHSFEEGAALKHWPLLCLDSEYQTVTTEDLVFAEACGDIDKWQTAQVADLRCQWLAHVTPQLLNIIDSAVGIVKAVQDSAPVGFEGFIDPITSAQYATPAPLFAQGPQHVLAAASSSYRRLDTILSGDIVLLRKGLGVVAGVKRTNANSEQRSSTSIRVVQFSANRRPSFGQWQLRPNRDEFFLVPNFGRLSMPERPLPSRRTDTVWLDTAPSSSLNWRLGCSETGELLCPPWLKAHHM